MARLTSQFRRVIEDALEQGGMELDELLAVIREEMGDEEQVPPNKRLRQAELAWLRGKYLRGTLDEKGQSHFVALMQADMPAGRDA